MLGYIYFLFNFLFFLRGGEANDKKEGCIGNGERKKEEEAALLVAPHFSQFSSNFLARFSRNPNTHAHTLSLSGASSSFIYT